MTEGRGFTVMRPEHDDDDDLADEPGPVHAPETLHAGDAAAAAAAEQPDGDAADRALREGWAGSVQGVGGRASLVSSQLSRATRSTCSSPGRWSSPLFL